MECSLLVEPVLCSAMGCSLDVSTPLSLPRILQSLLLQPLKDVSKEEFANAKSLSFLRNELLNTWVNTFLHLYLFTLLFTYLYYSTPDIAQKISLLREGHSLS